MAILTRKVHRGLSLCVLYSYVNMTRHKAIHTYVCMYVQLMSTPCCEREMSLQLHLVRHHDPKMMQSVSLSHCRLTNGAEKKQQKQQSHHQNSQILHRNATLQMITSCHRNWHDSIVSQTSHTFGKEVTYATYIHKFSDLLSNSSFTPGHNEPPPRQLMKARLSNECNA